MLFEKNADELRAPSSMMKLMTAEVVFNALNVGDVKLTDEYRISENAWRSRGGAPAGGSTMFAILNSKVSVDDLLKGAIIQSGNLLPALRWPKAWPAMSGFLLPTS